MSIHVRHNTRFTRTGRVLPALCVLACCCRLAYLCAHIPTPIGTAKTHSSSALPLFPRHEETAPKTPPRMEVPAILPELAPAPICIIDTTPNITPEETDFALMPVAAAEYENADVVYSALSLSELPATSPPPAPPKATSTPSRHSAAEYTPPQYAATPQPNYPAHLRQRRISGDVRVRIHINAQGKATKVEILSSPHPDLSRVTREKILTAWLFRAAKQGGKAVASVVTTTVCFES